MADIAPVATIQPYPSKSPWFDISQYLTAGLSPRYDQSCLACPDGNFIHFVLMFSIDKNEPGLEDMWVLRNLPNVFRVAVNSVANGWFTSPSGVSTAYQVEFSYGVAGAIRFPGLGVKLADFSGASLSLTAPRRKP